MGNLVRAELYKAAQHRLTLGALLFLCVGCPLLFVLSFNWGIRYGVAEINGYSDVMGAAYGLCQGMTVGPFLALPLACVVFSDQYRYGTLKNEAVFGISRTRSYLSRLLAGLLLGLALAAAAILTFALAAAVLLPGRAGLPAALMHFAPNLLMAVPMWLASGAIALCLLTLFRSSSLSAVLYMLYFTLGFFVLSVVHLVAVDDIQSGRGGLSARIAAFLSGIHPLYMMGDSVLNIEQSGGDILYSISMIPVQGVTVWGRVAESWGVGLLWVAATTVLALWVLRRRELR